MPSSRSAPNLHKQLASEVLAVGRLAVAEAFAGVPISARTLCAECVLLHGYAPSTRACMAQSAPMVPGLVLPVAIIRWVQRSSHWSSFAMEKSAHSASIRITKFSKNISIALIWSSAAAAVMALVISAFLLGAV